MENEYKGFQETPESKLEMEQMIKTLQKLAGESSNMNLAKQIKDLVSALEAGDHTLTRGAALKVDDQMKIADKYLTPKAKAALSKKGKSLIEEFNEETLNGPIRRIAICEYYVVRVRKDRIEEGVQAISNTINHLAEIGAIHSCLSPVSSLDLAVLMYEHPTAAVFAFVHIKPEFQEIAKNMLHRTMEGGVGESLHDLEIELAPGEFLADGRVTTFSMDGKVGASKESLIYQRVQEYLKYLPEGTKFLGYRECAIMDLSMPIELKFYNPLFDNVKRVELEYVRACTYFPDRPEGKQLVQYNKFLDMRYLQQNPLSKEKHLEWFPPRQF